MGFFKRTGRSASSAEIESAAIQIANVIQYKIIPDGLYFYEMGGDRLGWLMKNPEDRAMLIAAINLRGQDESFKPGFSVEHVPDTQSNRLQIKAKIETIAA